MAQITYSKLEVGTKVQIVAEDSAYYKDKGTVTQIFPDKKFRVKLAPNIYDTFDRAQLKRLRHVDMV